MFLLLVFYSLQYIDWFTNAGFQDVELKRIGPKWYRGNRDHGLIMGYAFFLRLPKPESECCVLSLKPYTCIHELLCFAGAPSLESSQKRASLRCNSSPNKKRVVAKSHPTRCSSSSRSSLGRLEGFTTFLCHCISRLSM